MYPPFPRLLPQLPPSTMKFGRNFHLHQVPGWPQPYLGLTPMPSRPLPAFPGSSLARTGHGVAAKTPRQSSTDNLCLQNFATPLENVRDSFMFHITLEGLVNHVDLEVGVVVDRYGISLDTAANCNWLQAATRGLEGLKASLAGIEHGRYGPSWFVQGTERGCTA